MIDPRFHPCAAPQRLGDVAKQAGASLPEGADPDRLVQRVASLEEADADSLAFCEGRRNARLLQSTRAGAVFVAPALRGSVPEGCVALVVEAPALAWAQVARRFHPLPIPPPGCHPSVVRGDAVVLGAGCSIGPFVVLGDGVELGEGCIVDAHAVIGPGCVLGPRCRIGAHVTISHARLGADVVVYPGARIGQDGFGFVPGKAGFVSIPQLGRVILEDEVEIGANTTIDRGALSDTVIGRGTRIDNLVQIGHNVRIGRASVIVALAGISGSTRLGNQVVVGGQAGFVGHIAIGDRARIGAQAGVGSDVAPGTDVTGTPARPLREVRTAEALLYAQVRERARRRAETGRGGAADLPDKAERNEGTRDTTDELDD